jgi:hypothetical protein
LGGCTSFGDIGLFIVVSFETAARRGLLRMKKCSGSMASGKVPVPSPA